MSGWYDPRMSSEHFEITTVWTGNAGAGTSSYTAYGRSHEFRGEGKPVIPGSSAPQYRGDAGRYNPEELLIASASACHMLWYLHLCAASGVVVESYTDRASGELTLHPAGSGEFASITLRPTVTLRAGSDADLASGLHAEANAMCFIARTLRCEVLHEPTIVVAP